MAWERDDGMLLRMRSLAGMVKTLDILGALLAQSFQEHNQESARLPAHLHCH